MVIGAWARPLVEPDWTGMATLPPGEVKARIRMMNMATTKTPTLTQSARTMVVASSGSRRIADQ
jgi:hypothetical protein